MSHHLDTDVIPIHFSVLDTNIIPIPIHISV